MIVLTSCQRFSPVRYIMTHFNLRSQVPTCVVNPSYHMTSANITTFGCIVRNIVCIQQKMKVERKKRRSTKESHALSKGQFYVRNYNSLP